LTIHPLPPSDSSERRSEILYGVDDAVGRGVYFMSNVKKRMDIYFDHRAPSIVVEVPEYRNGYIDIRKRGGKIRAFTEITKDNVNYCKELMKLVDELRHLNGVKGGLAVSETEYMATTVLEEARPLTQVIFSRVKEVVEQGQYVFDTLWNTAIPAEQKIKEIEEGVELADIEVIPSSLRAQNLYLDIVKAASEEVLWIFPTTNAFIRQDKIGAIPLAMQAARERNVKVRILMPANSLIIQKIQQLKGYYYRPSSQIDIRYIEQMSETKATIPVVDRKDSMVMELKDDSKSTFSEAIGLSTYSNSKAGVLSYVAIFENLWKQSQLYDQLKEAHEQLKMHDKMQKEFIDVAAHELRTPIQPILGLSEIVLQKTKDIEQAKLLEVISRNAKRLQRLTEDILDVTKIESQSLNLKRERFNLKDVITNSISDITTNRYLDRQINTVKIISEPQDVFVEADKARITQVISNLLDNAVKFTEEKGGGGHIHISTKNVDSQVLVSVKDSGNGIDPEILPKLFSKFTTKSERGTGLGLFISRNIVEAHGGRVWAKNNTDGKGATFYFSLPIVNK
jgi:two-component system, OmpR family, sensor histidine kinase VicK